MNTYSYTRLEPKVKDIGALKDVVVSLVVGMTGTDGETSAYIDTEHKLPDPDPDNFIAFSDITEEWVQEIAEQVAEEGGFKPSLDLQIEAAKERPAFKRFEWQGEQGE